MYIYICRYVIFVDLSTLLIKKGSHKRYATLISDELRSKED